jgi:glycosyltransferase involved in cell wall biosynthesis
VTNGRLNISIITPSFRPGPWLKLCLASVADQKGVEVEHIVQDACSDDGTPDWLRDDPRVRAFVEKDDGMYDAINRGLKRATGEIVAYLNCDEQYLPGTLARVAEFFARNPDVDVLFGDALLVDADGQALSYRRIISPERWHTQLAHLGTLSCAMFLRRRLIEEGFVFPARYRVIGDAVFVASLLKAGKRMLALAEPLSIFTFTGANLGQSVSGAQEERQWRASAGLPGVLLRPLVVLHHRLRKWLAGAYRRREVEYAIYTQQSPAARVSRRAILGWHWPAPAENRIIQA